LENLSEEAFLERENALLMITRLPVKYLLGKTFLKKVCKNTGRKRLFYIYARGWFTGSPSF